MTRRPRGDGAFKGDSADGGVPGLVEGKADELVLDRGDLEAALQGDKEALAGLIRRHWKRVFGYLFRLSGNYDLAEDLTQETFYRLWQGLPSLQAATSLRCWLFRVAHNAFVDQARSWHGRKVVLAGGTSVEAETPGPDPDPVLSLVSKRLEKSRALALLGRLSADHRAVVILRFYEELSLDEIAETLRVPVGTVKSRLHYAFRQLRSMLEDSGWAATPASGRAARKVRGESG